MSVTPTENWSGYVPENTGMLDGDTISSYNFKYPIIINDKNIYLITCFPNKKQNNLQKLLDKYGYHYRSVFYPVTKIAVTGGVKTFKNPHSLTILQLKSLEDDIFQKFSMKDWLYVAQTSYPKDGKRVIECMRAVMKGEFLVKPMKHPSELY